jgi:hypothetical protein
MFKINLIKKVGCDAISLIKINKALLIIEKVINSSAFEEKVKTFPFYFRNNIFTGFDYPYSNDEVYEMIMNAIENPGNVKVGVMDLYLHLKYGANGNEMGYSCPNEKEIYTYKAMLEQKSPKEIANHITHEWTHKLGFDHSTFPSPWGKRENSVPYAIGNMIAELADEVEETKTGELLMAVKENQ